MPSSQQQREARQSPAERAAPGWTKADFSLLKMLTIIIQLNSECFLQYAMRKEKEKKTKMVIQFSKELMQVKSYKQLSRKVKQWALPMMDFTECSLFYEDFDSKLPNSFLIDCTIAHDFFAIASLDDANEHDTHFATELIFGADQTIQFPSNFGVSGQVHEEKSYRFENEVGKVGKSKAMRNDDSSKSFSVDSQHKSFMSANY